MPNQPERKSDNEHARTENNPSSSVNIPETHFEGSETQILEPQTIETRDEEVVISESASVVSSEDSGLPGSPILTAEKEIGDRNAQTTGQDAGNASTGPKTELGKRRSSQNANKFGIYSNLVLLKGESRSELNSLREGLRKALQPSGDHEELLMEIMVMYAWRIRRVLRAEAAEIAKKTEFVEFDRPRREKNEAEEISRSRQVTADDMFKSESIGLIWNIQNPNILERCIELLIELQQGFKVNGFDEEQDQSLLKTICGNPETTHLRPTLHEEYLSWLDTARATKEVRVREGYPTPEECKKNVLLLIAKEIKNLKQLQRRYKLIESKRRKMEIDRQTIPDSPATDRIHQAERKLIRGFERASAQFERAKRLRKG